MRTMNKKSKDYFEEILSDVKPLIKKNIKNSKFKKLKEETEKFLRKTPKEEDKKEHKIDKEKKGVKFIKKTTINQPQEDKETLKIQAEIANQLLELKLSPKLTEVLVRNLRDVIFVIRTQERKVMQICVRDAGMPRKDFIAIFPKNQKRNFQLIHHIL